MRKKKCEERVLSWSTAEGGSGAQIPTTCLPLLCDDTKSPKLFPARVQWRRELSDWIRMQLSISQTMCARYGMGMAAAVKTSNEDRKEGGRRRERERPRARTVRYSYAEARQVDVADCVSNCGGPSGMFVSRTDRGFPLAPCCSRPCLLRFVSPEANAPRWRWRWHWHWHC